MANGSIITDELRKLIGTTVLVPQETSTPYITRRTSPKLTWWGLP